MVWNKFAVGKNWCENIISLDQFFSVVFFISFSFQVQCHSLILYFFLYNVTYQASWNGNFMLLLIGRKDNNVEYHKKYWYAYDDHCYYYYYHLDFNYHVDDGDDGNVKGALP